jgi:formate dehydrogenase iron-sulfur subunit
MALPLLERTDLVQLRTAAPAGIPERAPAAREQYRFHFDMSKCIGCKCCEVACNEQNNNPAEIRWRRVGEIEAGEYPFTRRFHLSMGCNHCLEAACLQGCPVDAYTKDALTGIVLHSADACIGCQYCTWNCPYGVPQFNPERGVVGKCDLCHGRLAEGREPACVNACPQGAIGVELVNVDEWRATAAAEANAPGMPDAHVTLSTTRITLPATSGAVDFQKADYHRVRPEQPHWPLVFLLVLTQASVGALAGGLPVLVAVALAHLGLGASLLHLGRPMFAWRALKMWRRSWLSREVLAFSVYAGLVTGCALLPALRPFAVTAGLLGIYSSARIYIVPARPSWNSWRTGAEFLLTAAIFTGHPVWMPAACAAQAVLLAAKVVVLRGSDEFEQRQSARLHVDDFGTVTIARMAALLAAPALPLAAGLVVALASEIAGRYLFFVTVVARNMAATFFGTAREAV